MATSTQHAGSTGDPGPTVFVLFGATGDLAKRLVLPAFYRLETEGLLPKQWRLVGNGRGDVAHEDFRAHFHDSLVEFDTAPDPKQWDAFSQNLFFAGGGFTTDDPGSLLDVIGKARTALGGDPQLVHYLAVPPVAFTELTKALGQHGLAKGARVVYEKPFGTSGENFRELDEVVHSVLDEQQVYRIDHFLGKEATQDLHMLRFANGLFASSWDRQYIESVQIDVPETLDINDRAVFYDATGAVLDMMVTHLFQLAAEVAMEPPASLGAMDLQAAREEVIGCFRVLDPAEVVLGQYDGYRDVHGRRPALQPEHLRRRPALGRQRPLARRAVLPAHRQGAGRVRAAGQPDPARPARAAQRPAAGRLQRALLLARGRRRDRPVAGDQEAGSRDRPRRGRTRASSWPASRTPTRCRPTSGSSTTCCSATARCSPARTGSPRSGRSPSPCSTTRPRSSPTQRGSWGPAEAAQLIAPEHWLLGQ